MCTQILMCTYYTRYPTHVKYIQAHTPPLSLSLSLFFFKLCVAISVAQDDSTIFVRLTNTVTHGTRKSVRGARGGVLQRPVGHQLQRGLGLGGRSRRLRHGRIWNRRSSCYRRLLWLCRFIQDIQFTDCRMYNNYTFVWLYFVSLPNV